MEAHIWRQIRLSGMSGGNTILRQVEISEKKTLLPSSIDEESALSGLQERANEMCILPIKLNNYIKSLLVSLK